MSNNLVEWAKTKKFAFLSPYSTPRGMSNYEIVNGITGVPFTFCEEQGADYYWFHDIKNCTHEELVEIFNKYDYWIYPVYPEYFRLLLSLKKELQCKILGVTDIQTHTLSYWSLDDVSLFVEAINAYDAVMCTNADEVLTFKGCLSQPEICAFTGWSLYPDELHSRFIKPLEERDENLISVGISNPGDFNRDLLTNLSVYKILKQRFPALKGFMYYVTPNKVDGLNKVLQQMGIRDFTLVMELDYYKAMNFLSLAYMAIHMYTFKVVGRLTQDCAALGVPMVGTVANLPNRLCFPNISVPDYDVEKAVDIATHLLVDKHFWLKTSNYANRVAFDFYGLEKTRERIFKLLTIAKIIQ